MPDDADPAAAAWFLDRDERGNPATTIDRGRPVAWTDGNRDFVPQLDELGPSTGFNLGTTNRFADDLKWPFAVEYSVGVQRSLPYEMLAGVTYINRQRGHEIGSKNLLVPTDTYIPLTVTEVSSGALVTVYNQDPATRGRIDILWDNEEALDSTYNGGDITFDKRLSNGWMFTGGVSNSGDAPSVNTSVAAFAASTCPYGATTIAGYGI